VLSIPIGHLIQTLPLTITSHHQRHKALATSKEARTAFSSHTLSTVCQPSPTFDCRKQPTPSEGQGFANHLLPSQLIPTKGHNVVSPAIRITQKKVHKKLTQKTSTTRLLCKSCLTPIKNQNSYYDLYNKGVLLI